MPIATATGSGIENEAVFSLDFPSSISCQQEDLPPPNPDFVSCPPRTPDPAATSVTLLDNTLNGLVIDPVTGDISYQNDFGGGGVIANVEVTVTNPDGGVGSTTFVIFIEDQF